MYNDKEKANEAARERMRRYRRNKKGVTPEGVTDKAQPGVGSPLSAGLVRVYKSPANCSMKTDPGASLEAEAPKGVGVVLL